MIAPASPAPAPADQDGTRSARQQSNSQIEVQTRIELVRIAFRQLPAGIWVSVVAVFALALLGRKATAVPVLLGWMGFMALPIAGMFWLHRIFPPEGKQGILDRTWALYLVIIALVSAAGWGATPWVFPALADGGPSQAAHLLLLAGLSAALLRVLLPVRKGSLLVIGLTMGPVAVSCLMRTDPAQVSLALFILLFVGYTLWTTLHGHRVLSDALTTRFERESLGAVLRSEISLRESRESELREATKKAESASKAKDDFIATISHELRTPMNGVLGMLRIVRDTELTPAQGGYVKTATQSAEALLALLNDVLDFSRVEANKLELEHAPFSPAEAARLVADQHRPRALEKGLQFDLQLREGLPADIVGDATRVRQILANLAGNAIKFTERGRIELRVDCIGRDTDQATLQFTVTDTGIGIDAAGLTKLFQPFTQVDNSMSRRYGGTGLGLALSQRLAHAMGGTLEVQSTVGQGTSFLLVLSGALPAASATPTSSAAGAEAPAPGGVTRVLVVEDDSVNRQVIELFLQKLNVTLEFAQDGEAAIVAATANDFDLVLMDCHLPGIDGLEATRRIRQLLPGKPLRIVALTANANPKMRAACLAAGMNDFLSKPVRFEQLSNLLQRTPSPR